MSERVLVIAAVPAFNMTNSLKNLIPQLLIEDYDRIVVLDDNSTDATPKIIKTFGEKAQYQRFDTNIGSAGNRNRIIGVLRKVRSLN